eukprot:PhM_4_TR18848/c1_g1_i4/m.70519
MSEKLSGVLKNSRRGSKTLCAAAVEAAAGPMSRPETPTSGGGPSPTFLNATNNSSPTQQQQQQPSKAVVEPPTTATSNTLAGQMARKKAKQSDANAEALTVPQSHRGPYEIRPYELTFYDAEVEARYCEFQFVENYFIGAIATFVLVVVCYVLLLVDAADDFGDAASVLSLLGIVATFALIGAFYKLQTHRESIALATVCVVSVVAMFHFFQGHPEEQRTVSYLCVTAVAVLLPQVRIHRLVVVFAPLSVLASVVILFAVPGYDPHPTSSHAEDILWLQGFIGWFVLLFFLERKQRMSFCQVDTNRNELKAIENHIEVMQDILATFFPRTPTRDLLAQRVETYSKPYPGTALIVTDISGFTAWSTRTEPRVVIDVLARLMYALESASPEYNVERVYTVGDSFVGAVFPMSSHAPQTDTNLVGYRCVQAILFGVAATQQPHKLGIPLRMRVGVHVGDLLGGFVGRSPPCFDLFGFAMLYAKHMEGTGVPGCVHISREALDFVASLGFPVEPEETEEGVICVGWSAHALTSSMATSASSAAAPLPLPSFLPTFNESSNSGGGDVRDGSIEEAPHHALVGFDREDTRAIVRQLIDMATPESLTKSKHHHRSRPAGDEAKQQRSATFNRLTLVFDDADMELEFLAVLRSRSFERNVLWALVFCFFFCYGFTVVRHCLAEDVDVALMGLMASCLFAGVTTMMVTTTTIPYGAYYWFVVYMAPTLPAISVSSDCSTFNGKNNKKNGLTNTFLMFLVMAYIAPQLCFNTPYKHRVGIALATTIIAVLEILYVQPLFRSGEENMVEFQLMFLIAPLPYVCMPYVVELSLRRAFATSLKFTATRESTGRYATHTRRALDVMLPKSIAELVFHAFLEMDRQAHNGNSDFMRMYHGQDLSQYDSVRGAGDTLKKRLHSSATVHQPSSQNIANGDLVWEYPLVCAMFVTFHLGHDTYDRVRPILD